MLWPAGSGWTRRITRRLGRPDRPTRPRPLPAAPPRARPGRPPLASGRGVAARPAPSPRPARLLRSRARGVPRRCRAAGASVALEAAPRSRRTPGGVAGQAGPSTSVFSTPASTSLTISPSKSRRPVSISWSRTRRTRCRSACRPRARAPARRRVAAVPKIRPAAVPVWASVGESRARRCRRRDRRSRPSTPWRDRSRAPRPCRGRQLHVRRLRSR